MSEIALTPKADGQVVNDAWYNDFVDALGEDFVPRDSDGIPTAGKNLGNSTYPWGSIYAENLVLDGELINLDQVLARNPFKIISGKVRSTSNQPEFLRIGTGGTATLQATTTPFVYEVNGEQRTISSDIAISGLTLAPGSNNTATINMASATTQEATRTWGENESLTEVTSLVMSSAGSEITALVGKRAAFIHSRGGTLEGFTAYVKSSTELSDCRRGFFFNTSGAPVPRNVINNGDSLILLKLGWLFLDIDGITVDVTYNEPVYAGSQPSSPSSGDYWYDLANSAWKRYNGTSYSEVDRIFIGWVACSSGGSTHFGRSADFYHVPSDECTLNPSYLSITTVQSKTVDGVINVFGNRFNFGQTKPPIWNIESHLITSTGDCYTAAEQANRTYHLYIKETGALAVADVHPYRRYDLRGWYHPHNPWRCIGSIDNVSSDFSSTTLKGMPAINVTDLSIDAARLAANSVTNEKMADNSVGTAELIALSVTRAKQAAVTTVQGTVDSYGDTGPTSYTDTDINGTITTVGGRPILVIITSGSSSNSFQMGGQNNAAGNFIADLKLIKRLNGGAWSDVAIWTVSTDSTGAGVDIKTVGSLVWPDLSAGAAGTLEYRLQAAINADSTFGISYGSMYLIEL